MSFPPAMCLPKSRIGKFLYRMEQKFLVPWLAFLLVGGVALVALSYFVIPVSAMVWGIVLLFV